MSSDEASLDDAIRGLRDRDKTDRDDTPGLVMRFATVTAVPTGTDGVASVTVSINGSVQTFPRGKSYSSPTVGDVVFVLLQPGGAGIVVDARVGLPSF